MNQPSISSFHSDNQEDSDHLLTVMILDDEPMAIEYLRNLIDWKRSGYRIVAEAMDGKRAVEIFRRCHPQIVLSDIRIPGIDGLDICRGMLNIDPSVKIILITAYSEFSYAKKAMEIGVHSYLLKHEITEKRLLDELEKVKKDLRREADENLMLARSIINERLSGVEDFPQLTGAGRIMMEKLGLTIILLLIGEDGPYFPLQEFRSSGVAGDGFFTDVRGITLPEEYRYIGYLRNDQGIETHLITHKDSIDGFVVRGDLEGPIREGGLEGNGRTFSAVVLADSLRMEELPGRYRRALKAFRGIPFVGTKVLWFSEDIPIRPLDEDERSQLRSLFDRFEESLGNLDFERAISTVSSIFSCFPCPERHPDELRETVGRLIGILDGCALENGLFPTDRSLVLKCRTLNDLSDYFIRVIEYMSFDFDSSESSYPPKISKAILYINKNYSKNISVADIAENLEISESNLCKSFRSETGKSVLDYLTGVRISVAKRLLVRTSKKIYQIAEMTGYRSSGYFGRVFLKETGMHPLEYRTCGVLSDG